MKKTRWTALLVFALFVAAGLTQAAYVTIGDANNTADSNGRGAVGYVYRISDHEVSIAEFQQATGAGGGEKDENYWNDGTRNLGNNAPVVNVSVYEAMKYCNWLTTGNVNSGYYSTSDGGVTWQANALSHDAYAAVNGLTYFLPTENEWYKAAYYTGNSSDYWSLYANGTDTAPVDVWPADGTGWNYNGSQGDSGSMWLVGSSAVEQNGTYDMMGNAYEWMEDGTSIRGGNYYAEASSLASSYSMTRSPTDEFGTIGFRVVAVPEPATFTIFGLVSGLGFFIRRRFMN